MVEWRRRYGSNDPWVITGNSYCGTSTSDTPAGPSRATIRNAFTRQAISQPTTRNDPHGNRTLVNLPTYFQVVWPTPGLAPGETSNPVTLLDQQIQFRITSAQYNYQYGDGTTSGWTNNPGGMHPTGTITHTYTQPGTYHVKVQTRISGAYRTNNGNWTPIATNIDLTQEPTRTLHVLTAQPALTQTN